MLQQLTEMQPSHRGASQTVVLQQLTEMQPSHGWACKAPDASALGVIFDDVAV